MEEEFKRLEDLKKLAAQEESKKFSKHRYLDEETAKWMSGKPSCREEVSLS